jgi:mannose-6-phosphate isomerase-like protein (cupin superfamily)
MRTEPTDVRPSPAASVLGGWFVERIAATALDAMREDARTALVEGHAARRGLMPPLHANGEDESYHVVAGELTFFVGAEVVYARVGDVVVAPRDVPRTYRVESDGARWLVLTRVASLARFEDFGRALAEPVAGGWPSAEEKASLDALAAANGIRVLGPPGLLPSEL